MYIDELKLEILKIKLSWLEGGVDEAEIRTPTSRSTAHHANQYVSVRNMK